MFSIRKPTPESISAFVEEQSWLSFSYLSVGASAGVPPEGYVVDRTHVPLGCGEVAFLAAKAALRTWTQFRFRWLELSSHDTPIQVGETVAVLARAGGLWCLNACRIVYVVDEAGTECKFGFAYGTLPGHVESGEERFLVQWNRQTDCVTYDILAFSKPNHFLARFAYPFVRYTQKRFARESAASMLRAVKSADH